MCGFIGLYSDHNVFQMIYDGLIAVQHRGQDAAGIEVFSKHIESRKGFGLVQEVFKQDSFIPGQIGIGHVRYPTAGNNSEDNIQPLSVNFPVGISMAFNGNITNIGDLRKLLVQKNVCLSTSSDLEILLYTFAEVISDGTKHGRPIDSWLIGDAVRHIHKTVKGAYSVIGFIAGHGLFAFKDPFGIKPLIMGTTPTMVGVASESTALDQVGCTQFLNIGAGQALWVNHPRNYNVFNVAPQKHTPCIFELIYFARPDSILDGISVHHMRINLGRALAIEWLNQNAPKPDVIIPVPDSARSAAQGFAEIIKIPYRDGLVKNRYIGRTFIMPSKERTPSINHKLNPIKSEFEEKNVLLIDDSIIRGNTARRLVEMSRKAGAKKVYMALTSAPIVYPCPYGIDMAGKKEFIAKNLSHDQVRKEIGADFLLYLPEANMISAATDITKTNTKFCSACFNGKYPTEDITQEVLDNIENDQKSRT